MAQTDCPRCQLPLSKDRYEGHPVLRCSGCWGYWLDPKAFERVLATKGAAFSAVERRQAEEAESEHPAVDGQVKCLTCGAAMEKRDVQGHLLLDVCLGHGVWLDTGEIKRVQVLGEADPQVLLELVKEVSGG